MTEWWTFVQDRAPELWLRLGQHILLAGGSTLAAIVAGIPLGILAVRHARLRPLITSLTGILQTVPSLAMLVLLLALFDRIGFLPAIVALFLYALLPIVRNTLTGLQELPAPVLEAADGMGMTRSQRLWMVELPLAMPVILAGIRTAAVIGVGITTLSAFIGAGGLGQFINRGLSLAHLPLILLGAVPSAILALVVDASLAFAQWSMAPKTRQQTPVWLRRIALTTPALILLLGCLALWATSRDNRLASAPPNGEGALNQATPPIRIGSKNFTEQLILGEILAQHIENRTDWKVVRQFDLGGTMICHQAMVHGEIDLYAEYTGTGLTAVLQQSPPDNPSEVRPLVAQAYLDRFQIVWLPSFGFDNSYALAVRDTDARQHQWRAISDLRAQASNLSAGWTFEFSERPDGYPGLVSHYGFRFGQVRDMEATLMYQAIRDKAIDVICAFATDGRIAEYGLRVLEDDRSFFPPYEACPIVRRETLDRHAGLKDLLEELAGRLDAAAMRRLNLSVDRDQRSPADAARSFLRTLENAGAPGNISK